MVGAMLKLTPLEQTALDAILNEEGGHRILIKNQLADVSVLSRENTGGGFFTELEVASADKPPVPKGASFGKCVWISIDGLEYGLGIILHAKNGHISLLEGYAVGPEDTSAIDFEHVRYALAEEQRPLADNGS